MGAQSAVPRDANGQQSPVPAETEAANGLTGIPRRIPLAATDDETTLASEHDEIIADAFLDTLARIALAVASRAGGSGDEGDR